MRSWLAALLALACAGGAPDPGPPRAEVRVPADATVLRVGTSGDYAPFSRIGAAGRRSGFDVEVVRAFARAHGRRVEWVPFSWTALARDFARGRFDLVASGVTVRPERSLAGRFSVPLATAGAMALVRAGVDLARPGVRIAVNRGGHLERVSRRLFPRATLVPTTPNAAVREAVVAGRVDAAVTDSLEAPHWLAGAGGLHSEGPFTRDWKAWWLPADAATLAREVDAWLIERESDGTLAHLRSTHLGVAHEVTATPLDALAAAVAERLSLMPAVAEAKRRSGTPVHVPEQEARVLDGAVAAATRAAEDAGRPPPNAEATRAFFAALIAAARAVQEATLVGPAAPDEPPDLVHALRPALARISERIAWLLVRLPENLPAGAAERALEPLDLPGLDDDHRRRIARTLAGLRP